MRRYLLAPFLALALAGCFNLGAAVKEGVDGARDNITATNDGDPSTNPVPWPWIIGSMILAGFGIQGARKVYGAAVATRSD